MNNYKKFIRCFMISFVFVYTVFIVHADSGVTHRWSFNDGTANDSIGSAHGVLVNNTGNAVFSGGKLTLGNDGSQMSASDDGDYLDLPNGIISANGDQATFEFWVTWNDLLTKNWQEFMSFGMSNCGEDQSCLSQDATYIMLTPQANSGKLRCGYRYGPTATEKHLNYFGSMVLNRETHVAVVWDAANDKASLYVDGQLTNQDSIHFSISNDLLDDNNWLGRSQWNDPMFVGSFNEVRIYDKALTAADIEANYLADANALPACDPFPADGAVDIPLDTVLSWGPGQILPATLTAYDIYLGTDEDAVRNVDTSDSAGIYRQTNPPSQTNYTPTGGLLADTQYFWRIDQRFSGQIVKGAVWSFNKQPEAWQMKQAPLMTDWADDVNPSNVLPEYPRPQMVRGDWMNLNGIWQFASATESSSVPFGQFLDREILVPFPVESAISGIMKTHSRFFYRRLVDIPAGWDGKQILLNIEASDWETEVYVNGSSVGVHVGGFDPFSFDITPYLNPSGSQEIIVRIFDPTEHSSANVRGKQDLNPHGIWYIGCSGIWDTIWLEAVNSVYINDVHFVPDVDNIHLSVQADVEAADPNQYTLIATAKIDGQIIGSASGPAGLPLQVVLSELHLWNTYDPFLYDLEITLMDGQQVQDQVDSYFGMRKVDLQEKDGAKRIFVNDEFIFQIGPLDQGYWPDGIYRAPTDEALKWDLEMTKAFGYNMSRKHVKVEPRRWYYWADKLGVLVWQDMPTMRGTVDQVAKDQFKVELEQLVKDHWNHPSVIMWIVFNEGWGQHDTVELTEWTMQMDPSRLVSCASGWVDYSVGHIVDKHAYPGPGAPADTPDRAMVCGEYGGIGLYIDDHVWHPDAWGYRMVYSSEELEDYYESLYSSFSNLVDEPGLSAGVYTQITDVEIEINGLITYDRKVIKVDPNRIREIHGLIYADYYEVIPTSQQQPQIWKYTTDQPAGDWYLPVFDDASWSEGPGGFGTAGTPGAVIGTEWNTSDIWIRREFTASALDQSLIDRLAFNIHHDEDVEIYINGVLAGSASGYTSSYTAMAMNEAGKTAFLPGQTNTIAVHCSQTTGGQYIDVGVQYRGCICIPGQCYDLTGDSEATLEDLAEISRLWLVDYDFDYLLDFANHWLECK